MFETRLKDAASRVQAHLDAVIGAMGDLPVVQAMSYASAGGKRLRAFLVMESARLHGIAPEKAVWAAASVEALHAYSLVHDDLPCMDDDDLRRGLPTVHVKWDQATAVLAGDALHTLAFELLSREEAAADPQVRADLVLRMARAVGAEGMVKGQALDIAAETADTPLTLEQITELQAGKTGALIEWSACAGAVLAGADPKALSIYAQKLGLAFQIWDDVLDVEGDAETVGKAVGKDAGAGKATFVSLLGLPAAKSRAETLVKEACDALDCYGDEAETLRQAARFVISRHS